MKLHMNDAPKVYYAKAVRQSLFSYQAVQSIYCRSDLLVKKTSVIWHRSIGSTLNLGGQIVNSNFKIDAKFCAQNRKSLINFISLTVMV